MNKLTIRKMIIFVLAILFGIMIPIQLRQNIESNPMINLGSIALLNQEVLDTRKELDNIKDLINNKQEELEQIRAATTYGDVSDVLKSELQEAKIHSGHVDLEGPGIIISISDNNDKYVDGDDPMDDIVHDLDILNIINDLKVAGAEAISIKGQRVLLTSEIQCGGPIIWINGRSITIPFVVKAIGDPKALYAAINAPGTYGDMLKKDMLEIYTHMSDNVLIPKHWKEPSYQFIRSIEEGE